jgi:MFS family permease
LSSETHALGAGSASSPVPEPRRRNDFFCLFAAGAFTNVGDGIVTTALPLLALRETHFALAITAVTSVAVAPWVVASLPIGVAVDRYDRRVLLLLATTGRAVTATGFAIAAAIGLVGIPLILVVAALIGTCEVLFDTTAQAAIPAMVEDEDLEAANSRISAEEMIGSHFVGPPIGAALFGIGAAVPPAALATCYLVALIPLANIRRLAVDRGTASSRASIPAEVVEGLKQLWSSSVLRTIAFLAAAVNATLTAVTAVLVIFCVRTLGVAGWGYGLLLASIGVGSMIGAIVAGAVAHRLPTILAMQAGLLVSSVGLTATGTAQTPAVAAAGLVTVGCGIAFLGGVTNSLRQRATPPELLGRVIGASRMVALGAAPAGGLAGGALVGAISIRAPFFASAAVFAGAGLSLSLLLRHAAEAHPTPAGRMD